MNSLRWSEQQHAAYFKLHQRDNDQHGNHHDNSPTKASKKTNSSYIIHRVHTKVPLQKSKKIKKVFDLLSDHECYLTEHLWPEDVWEISQLGFLLGLKPQFYNITSAQGKIQQELKTKLPPRTKIPKFRIAFSTPKVTVKNKKALTKAFAFEAEKDQASELLKLLKMAYSSTNEFVPFQMRNKHPEAYLRMILQQSKIIANQHIIILNNIGNDSMYYLSDHILTIEGVTDIRPTPTTIENGKHKILVKKEKFHDARTFMKENLMEWYEKQVPVDAKRLDNRKYGPPEVAHISLDDHSSGEGTYMTSSVITAMSFTTTLSDWQYLGEQKTVFESDIPISELVSQAQNTSWVHKGKETLPTITTKSVSANSHAQGSFNESCPFKINNI